MLQLFNQLQAGMSGGANDGVDFDNYMDLESQKKIAENIR
jgi:hypothetical protein